MLTVYVVTKIPLMQRTTNAWRKDRICFVSLNAKNSWAFPIVSKKSMHLLCLPMQSWQDVLKPTYMSEQYTGRAGNY